MASYHVYSLDSDNNARINSRSLKIPISLYSLHYYSEIISNEYTLYDGFAKVFSFPND